MSPPTLPRARADYYRATAHLVGHDPGMFERAGTTVAATPDRAGTRICSAYQLGSHTLICIDPELERVLSPLADSDRSLGLDDYETWATGRGSFIGGGYVHVIGADVLRSRPVPDEATLLRLDRNRAADVARITEFIEGSSEEDVDAAEFDLDDLDHLIVGLADANGTLAALASERPWENENQFGDIGVVCRPGVRGRGWGSAIVAALCEASFRLDRYPLYRCNWTNPASRRLALATGFVEVASLAAAQIDG